MASVLCPSARQLCVCSGQQLFKQLFWGGLLCHPQYHSHFDVWAAKASVNQLALWDDKGSQGTSPGPGDGNSVRRLGSKLGADKTSYPPALFLWVGKLKARKSGGGFGCSGERAKQAGGLRAQLVSVPCEIVAFHALGSEVLRLT